MVNTNSVYVVNTTFYNPEGRLMDINVGSYDNIKEAIKILDEHNDFIWNQFGIEKAYEYRYHYYIAKGLQNQPITAFKRLSYDEAQQELEKESKSSVKQTLSSFFKRQ